MLVICDDFLLLILWTPLSCQLFSGNEIWKDCIKNMTANFGGFVFNE